MVDDALDRSVSPPLIVRMSRSVSTLILLLAAPAALADEQAPFALNGNAKKGAVSFKKLCVGCHGAQGRGDGPSAKELDPKPANLADPVRAAELTDEAVYTTIREGGAHHQKSPLMVAWKEGLSDQELRDVTAYVRSLGRPVAKGGKKK